MPLWRCGCGFEKNDPCRPKECPECGGPRDGFTKAGEAAKKPAKAAAKKPVKKAAKK